MRKLLTILLAVLMAFGTCSLTACGPKGDDGFDKTKTQLYVGLFKAGLGREWLDQAKIDFEEKYKDVSFEEGKKGVEVVIDYKVTEFKVGTFQTNVPSLSNSIYFLDQSDYPAYASSGILKDVTSVLNKDVYDADGEIVDVTFDKGANSLSFAQTAQKSILDGMNPEYVYSFDRDGKYFGSPYRNIVTGMVYDADYFNEAKLYAFKDENPETGEKLGATMADVLAGENADGLEVGYGPDGIKGTLDDGMPETWDDFMTVLDNMGATPFIWSGAESYQRWYFYMNVWANYEGYNNFKINYSFSGNHTELGEINPDNAIEKLSEQLGRKAAIQAMYDMQSKASNVATGWKNTNEYQSQLQFIRSVEENKRIAMLLDGGYWEVNMINEFEKMANKNPNLGYGYGERDFRLFPIPNFDGQTNTDPTEVFYCAGPGLVCMPSRYKGQNAVQDTLAELFYYFSHSREQMVKFTGYTGGCVKPYDFEVKDSDTQYLTKFGKNILDRLNAGGKMVSDTPTSEVVRVNNSILYSEEDGYFKFRLVSGGVNYSDPISWFIGAGSGKTVEETFEMVKENIRAKCVLR